MAFIITPTTFRAVRRRRRLSVCFDWFCRISTTNCAGFVRGLMLKGLFERLRGATRPPDAIAALLPYHLKMDDITPKEAILHAVRRTGLVHNSDHFLRRRPALETKCRIFRA